MSVASRASDKFGGQVSQTFLARWARRFNQLVSSPGKLVEVHVAEKYQIFYIVNKTPHGLIVLLPNYTYRHRNKCLIALLGSVLKLHFSLLLHTWTGDLFSTAFFSNK